LGWSWLLPSPGSSKDLWVLPGGKGQGQEVKEIYVRSFCHPVTELYIVGGEAGSWIPHLHLHHQQSPSFRLWLPGKMKMFSSTPMVLRDPSVFKILFLNQHTLTIQGDFIVIIPYLYTV
jgi:hypothetical protein